MLDDFTSTALEKRDDFVDVGIVILLGNAAHAASEALLYMEVKARTYLSAQDDVRSDSVSACAQRIDIVEEFNEIAGMNDAAVRTEITGTVTHEPAGQKDPWKLLCTHAYPRISLRVLEEDVVSRLELLDEVVFQQQRIRFGLHYRKFGIGDLRDHDRRLAGKPFCRYEILRDPLVQVLCLTHINDIPLGVIISVDAWGMWK
jgi:hypothetical protein